MKLYSPSGRAIIGTYEMVCGVALIDGATELSPVRNGRRFALDYEGTTEIDWDDGETVKVKGQRIFVDEDGNHWPENKLELK